LRSESEKKEKTAHPTTDNANVTAVEEEDAYARAYASGSGECRLPRFFTGLPNASDEIQVPRKNAVGKLPTTAG
jgi:hypothetical protein